MTRNQTRSMPTITRKLFATNKLKDCLTKIKELCNNAFTGSRMKSATTEKEIKMYQVTAIYEDSEVGYGEGEGLDYAIEDCIESIPSIFEGADIKLTAVWSVMR